MNLRIFDSESALAAGLDEAIRATLSTELRPRVLDTRSLPPPSNHDAGQSAIEWIGSSDGIPHVELLITEPESIPESVTASRVFLVPRPGAIPTPADAGDIQGRLPAEADIWWFVTRDEWERHGGMSRDPTPDNTRAS